MAKRHKWDKVNYSGRFSKFEIYATCKVCGAERKRISCGYIYKDKDGKTKYYAPPCE